MAHITLKRQLQTAKANQEFMLNVMLSFPVVLIFVRSSKRTVLSSLITSRHFVSFFFVLKPGLFVVKLHMINLKLSKFTNLKLSYFTNLLVSL